MVQRWYRNGRSSRNQAVSSSSRIGRCDKGRRGSLLLRSFKYRWQDSVELGKSQGFRWVYFRHRNRDPKLLLTGSVFGEREIRCYNRNNASNSNVVACWLFTVLWNNDTLVSISYKKTLLVAAGGKFEETETTGKPGLSKFKQQVWQKMQCNCGSEEDAFKR